MKSNTQTHFISSEQSPSRDEVEEAVRTLIAWAGDDCSREGLKDTPRRVADSFREFFSGYNKSPEDILSATFEEFPNYDEMVLLRNMRLESHCEHHMVPIIGRVHVAYIPSRKLVGISKLARLVDMYAKRLQTQEVLTSQIADTIYEILQPRGVAVLIEAEHQCMTTRGVHKTDSMTITSRMHGEFKSNIDRKKEFLMSIGLGGAN